MKIGVIRNDYPIRRNILNKISGAQYIILKKNNNLFHSLSTLKNLIFRKKLNFEGQYFFYQKPKIDVLHLYNEINYSSQKWVASCETLVPRFEETKNDHQMDVPKHHINNKTEKALQQIIKNNCLGIICISNAAATIQKELLNYYPEYENQILEKLIILHPSQCVLERNSEAFYAENKVLRFIFVGTQFHLKGGVEMVQVLEELQKQYKFQLSIVSAFKTDSYVTNVSEAEANETMKMILEKEWISVYENIGNDAVLNLIKESHVGILPTWSDTYGFSVLEMQAAGVPVITTDIRALPEINNEDCGWLIHLPQNRLKQALYFSAQQREILRQTLKEQLELTLKHILDHPEQLIEKSKNAVKRIEEMHNPKDFEEKLKQIYAGRSKAFNF